MTTLASVLQNLKSDKIKVRQEALSKIREVFSKDHVVENFTKSSNSLSWLAVFQALFEAVMAEKRAVVKPSTQKAGVSSSAATRRLSDAASVVRWLTELTVQYMNMKVVNPLMRHLCQTLQHEGELLAPVALDYVKALKCLVNFTPHLEHIDDNSWVRLAELSFNVILDDPLETKLVLDGNDTGADGSDSEMYIDDDILEEATDSGVGRGKKRPRRDPTPTPILSPRKAKARRNVISVSLEQVECASLLSILLSSSVAPILSPNYPGLATAILLRLQRFLERYPADSSLLHDYLAMLSSTLQHLSLNKKLAVEKFARSTWVGLVGLLATKDRRMKEGLVVILRNLFEFVTCPSLSEGSRLPTFDRVDGISRLWNLLDGEGEGRRGLDGLSLEALRLQIWNPINHAEDPFVAKTFRAGWNFDSGQALAWAILELQADCAAKLFQFSESIHSTTPGPSIPDAKRFKIPNPIFDLLNLKQDKKATIPSHIRGYRLQILLFFVDRHWHIVHDTLKHDIVKALLDLVAFEDVEIQSWVFLNLAAIAHEEGSIPNRKSAEDEQALNATIWDSAWAHAIRKTNVPAICRAACHAGLSLLTSFYSKTHRPHLLTSNRVLLEIETFAKDMDVQGPSYPFDSVCMFLSHCLTIASQDVRLYRMHLEDKVLSWFVDSWKISDSRIKLAPNTTADILLLLETLCGLSKRVDLIFRPLLPQSHVVDSVIEEKKVRVIRDFLLYAKLPPFTQHSEAREGPSNAVYNNNAGKAIDSSEQFQTVTPRGRERKLSSFLLRTLESHIFDWENNKDGHNHPTAEMARRSLDVAATAIAFESMLLLNGTVSNRQVLQTSAKLIALLTRFLAQSHWSIAERLFVAHSLEIFISYDDQGLDGTFREAFAQPGPGSGIKKQILQNVLLNEVIAEDRSCRRRLDFLRLIWQNVDAQEALGAVRTNFRSILNQTLNGSLNSGEEEVADLDDKDGFGPIRTIHQNPPNSATGVRNPEEDRPTQHLLQLCAGFLACGPFLQSPSAEPTRDKELVQLLLETARTMPDKICHISSIFFRQVRRGTLSLNPKHLCDLYTQFGDLLGQYSFSKSERFLGVVLDLLTCSFGARSDPHASAAEEVQENFCQLCGWLSKMLKKNLMRSWRLRDTFARFIELYLLDDPSQSSWTPDNNEPGTDDSPQCPPLCLPQLSADIDIRVRFRVAVINTRLLAFSKHINLEPLQMYDIMKRSYTLHLDNYEHMLTRMLSLGNIMVVSSAVRRGPYWHLLETCLHSQQYSDHIESILTGVSARLGMSSLSTLFEAYASQIAYSVSQSKGDFTGVPPHLLGYRDRRRSAEATFRLFSPTNILTNAQQAFERHCQLLQKSSEDGVRECFGNIVGLLIVSWVLNRPDGEIVHLIKNVIGLEDFQSTLEENVDAIVTTILRSLGDQDFSINGPIIPALQAFDETNKIAPTFQALNNYRSADDNFACHIPNLPAFPTQNTLKSLHWLSSTIPSAYTKATTYHVLQQLMREIYTTPLVNEQYRLINAMTLWMAYRRHDFDDVTLLHTVVHGASLLLSQYDLARSAQSILEWAFRCYRRNKLKDSRLPDVFIRISYIAHGFASDTRDRSTSQMGATLLTWIEGQLDSLSAVMEASILRALTVWPQAPSDKLMPIYKQITTQTLTTVLEDHRITSNKFRLVRQIQDHTRFETNAQSQFSKFYFWRLKDCMPLSGRLQDEDVQSFTTLLAQNYGKIGSFSVEQPDLNAPRPRHRRVFKKKDSILDSSAARDAITLGIFLMLEDDDPSHVSNAYQTLRLLTSVSSPNHQFFHLPSDYRAELELLKIYRCLSITRPVVNIHDVLKSDLYLESANNFSKWISLIAVLLSDTLATIDPYFGQLSSLLISDTEFADQILPILVHTLLLHNSKKAESRSYRTTLSEYFTLILTSKNTDLSCIRVIVDVVLHLRYFNLQPGDALAYNKWLEVDFALLARAAILCGAYTTALLFVETAMEQKSSQGEDSTTEEVLFEIYAHIDEPDGFYGIETKDLHQFLIKRLHHEKQWDKAFRFHGAALEAGRARTGEGDGLLQSFHYFGFDRLAIDTLRNTAGQSRDSDAASSMDYRLGWRTETWDLPDRAKESSSAPLYRSLKAVYRERDPRIVEDTIRSSLFEEMERLQSLGTENLVEIRSASQDLMCLGEILGWMREDRQDLLKPEKISLENWEPFINLSEQFEFSDFESLMATRISLIRSVRQREERQRIGTFVTSYVRGLIEIERSCLLRLSAAARASGQIQIALNSVIRAQCLETIPSAEVSEEFAIVLWLQKEEKLAVQFLKDLVHRAHSSDDNKQGLSRKALWLSRLGTWTAEACIEKPTEIWDRYFEPSILLLERVQELDSKVDLNQATIYRECAMFAERQFHATLRSPDAVRWKVYVDRKRQEIEQRSVELRSNSDVTRQKTLEHDQAKARKLLQADSELFKKHNTLRETFLKQAMDMHSRCLQTSDSFDNDSAIRFCSLWFANFDDESILECVRMALAKIPSRKLVFLAHQITARVASPSNAMLTDPQDNLHKLVVRMCEEHPFHVLYQVYCLSDHSSPPIGNTRQSGRFSSQATQTDRGTAASTFLDRLRGQSTTSQRVRDLETLCDAYLQWAKLPIAKDQAYKVKPKPPSFKVPSRLKILQISNLRVPVTTASLPLDLTLEYNNCVWIKGYEQTFTTAGGVNMPKISICQGSDGQGYKQLFKGEGNDDLRQDAVMEQVFDLVNSVLRRDRETNRRELKVRDYKVIPLASQAGILEFVGNTSPLRDWLTRAHPRYNPTDMKPGDFHERLQKVQTDSPNDHRRQLNTFMAGRKKFKPVMRHYFTEKHKTPITWFQMRLCYSRSIATTSLVGHVLGLGDRHVSNILLDNVTGEVVHIDLGIAFDQGKLLPIPERVPFRMTADIIDGMGPSGTSGVFQRCSEETLRVLREESELIMTVLEVFKHDPLHSWTASEVKVKQAQTGVPTSTSVNDTTRFNLGIGIDMSSGSADEAADRALSSVARKLDTSLSVESTVNELIAEATDPMNLATIFYGWSPYL
ncbi:hypothetical protein M413DRAFT_442693 [Hebeloma cylindrosporum]|uniref:Serine/threonine-protein kinase Tel1 n=1 Tax=Hebeloma cylindrosporum TaxID=76867 RepID=A0A0C3CKU7_HEBCY|nr:hypothetical protein M413DRAFT_442693 [Hebeloma cylindrosporum h7]